MRDRRRGRGIEGMRERGRGTRRKGGREGRLRDRRRGRGIEG